MWLFYVAVIALAVGIIGTFFMHYIRHKEHKECVGFAVKMAIDELTDKMLVLQEEDRNKSSADVIEDCCNQVYIAACNLANTYLSHVAWDRRYDPNQLKIVYRLLCYTAASKLLSAGYTQQIKEKASGLEEQVKEMIPFSI